MEIKGQGRGISCKGSITAANQRIVSLTNWDDGPLVTDNLCDEAIEEGTAAAGFNFGFAARKKLSSINMLCYLLRQLVIGLEEILEVVVRPFQNWKKVSGGRDYKYRKF